jgi:hypothetical protein
MKMQKLLAILFIAMMPAPLLGQPSTAKPSEDLKTLTWMVGQWEGESWIELTPGQRRTNRSLESVRDKVGGSVLLIEGCHKEKRSGQDGKDEGAVTHESISMLIYDGKAKRYRFVAYTARQGYGDFEAKLLERGWEWEMPTPTGRIRFTITHTKNDEWSEKGEASQDGKTWHPFFGMLLHRVK